jgi:hypothetical protein
MLVLSGTVDMPSENMLLSILRTMFSRTPRLAPLFNIYDLNPSTSPGQLLTEIRRVCAEGRGPQDPKAKAAAAPSAEKATAAAAKAKAKGRSHPYD